MSPATSPTPPVTSPVPTTSPSPPVVVGAIALAGTAVLAVADPTSSPVPLCPLKALTGLDCPFCGSLRAVHALTRGDLAGALDHNVLFTVSVPLLIVGWCLWFAQSRGRPEPSWWRTGPRFNAIALSLLIAFAVVRNLPFASWLASGT